MRRDKQATLKKQILEVLESTPKSRDSDQYLTLCIWNRYYPQYIKNIEEPLTPEELREWKEGEPTTKQVKYVSLQSIMHLPREDGVKRTRAVIQNKEKKFLPTTLKVARQRQIAEVEWREWARENK